MRNKFLLSGSCLSILTHARWNFAPIYSLPLPEHTYWWQHDWNCRDWPQKCIHIICFSYIWCTFVPIPYFLRWHYWCLQLDESKYIKTPESSIRVWYWAASTINDCTGYRRYKCAVYIVLVLLLDDGEIDLKYIFGYCIRMLIAVTFSSNSIDISLRLFPHFVFSFSVQSFLSQNRNGISKNRKMNCAPLYVFTFLVFM